MINRKYKQLSFMTVCATSFVNLCMYEEGSLISEDLQSGLNLRILPAVTLNKRKTSGRNTKHVKTRSFLFAPFLSTSARMLILHWTEFVKPFALHTNHGLF